MNRLSACFLTIILGVANVSAQVKYATYTNERYSFSIEFPESLLKMQQPTPGNDFGTSFLSRDRKVDGLVTAFRDELKLQPKDWAHIHLYRAKLDDAATQIQRDGFILSGEAGSRIYFQKTIRQESPNAHIYYTFIIKYPKSQRKKWEPIVRQMADSFKFVSNANVRP
jgi:hypothetical protein